MSNQRQWGVRSLYFAQKYLSVFMDFSLHLRIYFFNRQSVSASQFLACLIFHFSKSFLFFWKYSLPITWPEDDHEMCHRIRDLLCVVKYMTSFGCLLTLAPQLHGRSGVSVWAFNEGGRDELGIQNWLRLFRHTLLDSWLVAWGCRDTLASLWFYLLLLLLLEKIAYLGLISKFKKKIIIILFICISIERWYLL